MFFHDSTCSASQAVHLSHAGHSITRMIDAVEAVRRLNFSYLHHSAGARPKATRREQGKLFSSDDGIIR
jgi:hypothetical protein